MGLEIIMMWCTGAVFIVVTVFDAANSKD